MTDTDEMCLSEMCRLPQLSRKRHTNTTVKPTMLGNQSIALSFFILLIV